jgi:NADH dehydrogenase
LKTLTDARQIKNHIIQVFEKASLEESPQRQKELLTFVVSGGGYIGVQLIAALRDFLYRDLAKSYQTVDPANIRLILAEIKPKIISPLHTKLGAYVMNYLRKSGIDVRLKSRVTEIDANHVVINGKENIPTNTLIWVAGLLSNPQIARLDAKKDDIGRVFVNENLQLPDFPNVYAVGDCAHFADASGQPIPPKAHTAVRQAKVAVHNILASIEGRQPRRYVYSNPFEVIPLGPSNGVFSFYNLRLYGPIARFLWMAGYAILVPKMYNRIRISTDWLLSMIFGRDLNYLK